MLLVGCTAVLLRRVGADLDTGITCLGVLPPWGLVHRQRPVQTDKTGVARYDNGCCWRNRRPQGPGGGGGVSVAAITFAASLGIRSQMDLYSNQVDRPVLT